MICSCANCHIKTIFFESLLDAKELEKYCDARSEITIRAGESIIKQGDTIKSFKYLYEGLIKLHRTNNNGTEQIISFGKPMDFVSIHNIFSNDKYNYSVTALEDTVVCKFDLNVIRELITSNGVFAQKIIETTNKSSNRILTDSLNLISKSMYGKVASVLLFFNEEIYLKDGTIYFLDATFGTNLSMYITVPAGNYYPHSNGSIPASALGLPGDGKYEYAVKDVLFASYVMRHHMLGDCPMGDELNAEGAQVEGIPIGWYITGLIITNEDNNSFKGCGGLEMYRPHTIVFADGTFGGGE